MVALSVINTLVRRSVNVYPKTNKYPTDCPIYSRVLNKRAARFILFSKFSRDQKFSKAYIFGFCGLFHCHLIEM